MLSTIRTTFIVVFSTFLLTIAYAQIAPAPPNYSCEVNLFSEGFEGGIPTGWTVKTSNYNGPLISYSATSEGWFVHTGPTATLTTGPSAAYEGSYYVYCEGSGPVAREDTASLTSPMIALNTNASLSVSFYTNLYGPGGAAGRLGVYVLTGGVKTTLLTPIPSNTHSSGSSATWEQVYLDLNAFRGQTIQLVFEGVKPPAGADIDISIDQIEVCSSAAAIPAVSNWGLLLIGLAVLVVGSRFILS